MEKLVTHSYTGRVTLSIGGITIATDDVVMTPYGPGTVISLDPFGDLEVCVRLFTPNTDGSVFWFGFEEVLAETDQGES